MWSVGVVLAILLNCMKESQPDFAKRYDLFTNDCCFPLSCESDLEEDGEGNPILPKTHFLKKIVNTIGTPDEDD